MNFIDNNIERNLIFYFQIHQPKRLRPFNLFDVGSEHNYFNNYLNNKIIQRAVHECYLPTNALLLRLIKTYPQIKIALSISGVTLEQFEDEAPEVLESFKALAATGSVEFLAETYYHSLACLQDTEEFETQVVMHAEKIYEHFGKRPVVFRNTELVYNNNIGKRVSNLGFHGIFTDGIKRILGQRSIHHLYNHPEIADFKILLRNFQLSDDIAFRFKDQALTVEKYIAWLNAIPQDDKLVNIAMDYETFGEHNTASSGIFLIFSKNY